MSNPIQIAALAIRLQASRELLAILANSESDKEAGRKALLLAWILEPELIGSQKELARKMGVSQARVSQMLRHMRLSFSKLNH
jgi:hypothetical protein